MINNRNLIEEAKGGSSRKHADGNRMIKLPQIESRKKSIEQVGLSNEYRASKGPGVPKLNLKQQSHITKKKPAAGNSSGLNQ